MQTVDARLFQQCHDVYHAMFERRVDRDIDNACCIRVYVGHTTYLVEELGYSISSYTPIMRRLQSMGCIKQLVRGGRGIPSEWQLLKPPSESDFVKVGQRWLRDRHRIDELEERVRLLEETLDQAS